MIQTRKREEVNACLQTRVRAARTHELAYEQLERKERME
jgi:hypothetical protein